MRKVLLLSVEDTAKLVSPRAVSNVSSNTVPGRLPRMPSSRNWEPMGVSGSEEQPEKRRNDTAIRIEIDLMIIPGLHKR
jgi:hypothetical protein